MFNVKDIYRDEYMLDGKLATDGYDWWWHSFTGRNAKTGEEKTFFLEYFMCNPAYGDDNPHFGRLGEKPSYLMVKAGCWGDNAKQLHRFFAWNEVNVRLIAPFEVWADDCHLNEHGSVGRVCVSKEDVVNHPEYMSDAGSMEWKLTFSKDIAFNVGYGAGDVARELNAFEMFWHAEGMKTAYCGTVWLDGVEYTVRPDTCYGYADKNWGRDFTSPWIWLSSNDMTSRITGKRLKNSAFDIGGGKPKVFGIPLHNRLLGALFYEGEEFEYNFSKPWTMARTKYKVDVTDTEVIWHIAQSNRETVMKVVIRCKKSEMLFINYESPDGEKRYNHLYNGGTGKGRMKIYAKCARGLKLIDDIDIAHVGCEYGIYD